MGTIVIRYRAKPDQAAENRRLVEAVFEELNAIEPAGLRYATYRLADDTFLHIAEVTADPNPLSGLAAFARFQEAIGERCEPGQGPDPQQASLVGSYRFFEDQSGS
jgi:hypothetical protein